MQPGQTAPSAAQGRGRITGQKRIIGNESTWITNEVLPSTELLAGGWQKVMEKQTLPLEWSPLVKLPSPSPP